MQNDVKNTNREHMGVILEFEEGEKKKFREAEKKREEKIAEQMKFLELQKGRRIRAMSNKTHNEMAMSTDMAEFNMKLNSKMDTATSQYNEILADKRREV